MTHPPNQPAANDIAHVEVRSIDDILPAYRGTPIETLLSCHNLDQPAPAASTPEMIIATCMDHRVTLKMPEGFALVLRTAGANIEPVLFNIACAISIARIRTIAVIGHSDCAMENVNRHREVFLDTLADVGTMSRSEADAMFERGAEEFGIVDAAARAAHGAHRLRELFPDVMTCALYYDVADGTLRQLVDS